MNQVWYIFRKDARHHWPSIAASLALLVAFAWFDIRSWSRFDGAMATGAAAAVSFFFVSQTLPGLVNVLLPLSWMFLIVRVVQGESLVGDRQFWVTRPYDWKQLLAAKLLFVLVFINFPFLCMNAFLLARAGFHPTHYIVGLLWIQLLWTISLFLAVAALATVTRNIPQMLLAALFIVLYVIGITALFSFLRKSNFSGSIDSWSVLLLGSTAVAIIFIQYSRRRTALSLGLIVGVCALLTLISVATPVVVPDRKQIAREYPLSTGNRPVELALARPEQNGGEFARVYSGDVSIQFPLSVAGIPQGSFLRMDGMIVTLTKANGFRWDSSWQRNALWMFPDLKLAHIGFQIKQNIFDQLNSGPVTAHLLLAFTEYRENNSRPFTVPSSEFSLPEVGRCTSEFQHLRGIQCLAPLRRPTFLLVTTETAANTCRLGNSRLPSPPFVRAFVQGGFGPAEMGISPVHQVLIDPSEWDPYGGLPFTPGLCPGTPLTLSHPEVTGSRGLEVEFDNVSLDDFRERLPK